MTLARRFAWLTGCVVLGLAIGFIGFHFTAESAWFIAVPAVLAVGWFAIADPTQCVPPNRRGADGQASGKRPLNED